MENSCHEMMLFFVVLVISICTAEVLATVGLPTMVVFPEGMPKATGEYPKSPINRASFTRQDNLTLEYIVLMAVRPFVVDYSLGIRFCYCTVSPSSAKISSMVGCERWYFSAV